MKLWTLDGTKIVSFNGSTVRECATVTEATAALVQLEGYAALRIAKAVDADEDPKALAAAIDATLDAAGALIGANDTIGLPPWAQQVMALVTAAEAIVDQLLEVMGVPDPDDMDD